MRLLTARLWLRHKEDGRIAHCDDSSTCLKALELFLYDSIRHSLPPKSKHCQCLTFFSYFRVISDCTFIVEADFYMYRTTYICIIIFSRTCQSITAVLPEVISEGIQIPRVGEGEGVLETSCHHNHSLARQEVHPLRAARAVWNTSQQDSKTTARQPNKKTLIHTCIIS